METDVTHKSPRRASFSLLTVLLVTAIVALSIVVAKLYVELKPLRAQLKQLRDEVGELSVEDESKVYAISVRTADDFTWKWRVWIPEGRQYLLHYTSESIPKQGYPRSHGTITIVRAGEMWIEYRITRGPRSGKMTDKLSASTGSSVGSSEQSWVDSRSVSTGDGVGRSTTEFEPDEVVLLNRHRVSTTVNSSSMVEDPSQGFMVWLEPTTGASGPSASSRSAN